MPFCGTARWERTITVIAVVFVLIASIFMASSLVGLKSCVSEFDPDAHHDAGTNQERRWKQWLENLELVMDFEGITDPVEGPSKKQAALLAVGGALSTARSIELTEKEIAFMKQNPLQSLATPVHAVRGFKQTTHLDPNLKVRLLNCVVIVGNECLTKANAKLWVSLATTARKETILLAFVKLRSRLSLSKWLILKMSLQQNIIIIIRRIFIQDIHFNKLKLLLLMCVL